MLMQLHSAYSTAKFNDTMQDRKLKRMDKEITVPLFENGFVLLLPLVLEVRGELMPDGEEDVRWNLFLSCFGLHWEKHCKFQEPENTPVVTLIYIWHKICSAWVVSGLFY